MRTKRTSHIVKNGMLQIKGSPYSQFSIKGIESENYTVKGKFKLDENGFAWLRVNNQLLFGIQVSDDKKEKQSIFIKHSLGDFSSYDQAYKGTPIKPGIWTEFKIEYRFPSAKLFINGVMQAQANTATREGRETMHHFGLCCYLTNGQFRDLKLQKLKTDRSLDTKAFLKFYNKTEARLGLLAKEKGVTKKEKKAYAQLSAEKKGMLASVDDYIRIAEDYRKKPDWLFALSLLEENYRRFEVGTKQREKAELYWRKTQEKFDLAQEALEAGDMGLDNIILTGKKRPVFCMDINENALWFFVEHEKRLIKQNLATQETTQFKLTRAIIKIQDAGDYLMAIDADKQTLLKIDKKDPSKIKTAKVPRGEIVDLKHDPNRQLSYISVNENAQGIIKVKDFKIYCVAEETLAITNTGAFGMGIAIDPYSRYVYTAISFQIQFQMRGFDPSPLRIEPDQTSRVDHIMCFKVNDKHLELLNDRARPGSGGRQILVDPSGRFVAYVALNGFTKDNKKELTGPAVAAFRTANVNTTVSSFNSGGKPMAMAFNPLLPVAYIYNGSTIQVFDTRDFKNIGSMNIPGKIKPGSIKNINISHSGKSLLLSFQDSKSGIYLKKLTLPDALRNSAMSEFLKTDINVFLAETLKLKDQKKIAERLSLIIKSRGFSKVGEEAAGLYLKKSNLFSNMKTLVAPKATPPKIPANLDFKTFSLPNAKDENRKARIPKYFDKDDFKSQYNNLKSYESLFRQYPQTWFYHFSQLIKTYPDSADLYLMYARQLLKVKETKNFLRALAKIIALKQGGWYSAKVYSLYAEHMKRENKEDASINALYLTLNYSPRNFYVHRKLANILLKKADKKQAHYHMLASLYIFPSQPALIDELSKEGIKHPFKRAKKISIDQLYKDLAPSTAWVKHSFGSGTGFLISSDGIVMTNHHVINGGEKNLSIIFKDKEGKEQKFPGTVIASDPHLDIALVKINLGKLAIKPIILADHKTVKAGMNAIAIGNPGMGAQILTLTITEGIVSSSKQNVGGQSYIQTSAAVNPGNSGGPLFNDKGQVIGMVTLKAQLDNVGFAIPTDRLFKFIEETIE
ncbi:MAG: trypsin-like peptidase domain-containing protein [Lentisphaeria bacterium]|nr:trypsin-like peptidase domain-containing protein [Lentisphaeria bacterium]